MSKLTRMYLSLKWPTWPSSILTIDWWCSVPISEANGALGSIPIIYALLHYSLWFDSPLIPVPNLLSIPTSMSTLTPLFLPSWEHQVLLLPPSCQRPQFWPTLCIQEYVQNGASRYVLRHCVLPPGDIRPDPLNPIHQTPLRNLPWDLPRQPVVESPQKPLSSGGHHPRLQPNSNMAWMTAT